MATTADSSSRLLGETFLHTLKFVSASIWNKPFGASMNLKFSYISGSPTSISSIFMPNCLQVSLTTERVLSPSISNLTVKDATSFMS